MYIRGIDRREFNPDEHLPGRGARHRDPAQREQIREAVDRKASDSAGMAAVAQYKGLHSVWQSHWFLRFRSLRIPRAERLLNSP
ncbi:MAG: hypothetical protein BroJett024_40160 [Alphaproteobacteria bacterium]|nr:MAG: hypothetical protein BroJett024_40160 [Alphaproteobacteria bacterium]